MKKFIAVCCFFILSSLVTKTYAAEPKLNSIILDAKILTYNQLTPAEKSKISEYCCSYAGKSGWVDSTAFEAEKGYFVRAKINRQPLAYWTFLYSCGKTLTVKKCSEKEHAAKIKKAIQDNNPYGLYGKYNNSWIFYNGKNKIPATDKFDGHDILTDKRDKKKQLDELLIGPLPQKPSSMTISLYYGMTDKEKEIIIPQFKINIPTPTKKVAGVAVSTAPKIFTPTNTPTPMSKANVGTGYTGSLSGDKDCPDFPNHEAAQAYFIAKGGSPTNNVDRLDRDHDGLACED